eukprot:30646_1
MRASTPLFCVDYRSLIAFRILLCLWVFRDIGRRWYFNSIEAFLSSDGVFQNIDLFDWKFDPILSPILYHRGTVSIQYIFCIVHIISATLLLFEYHMTLTSIISYLLTLGLQTRCYYINDSSDRWYRCLSFLFIASCHFSSFKMRNKKQKHIRGIHIFVLLFQCWIIYPVTVINRFKNYKQGSWLPYDNGVNTCTAVYLSITRFTYATNIGYYVASLSPYLMYLLCVITNVFEVLFPTLLIFCNYDIVRYVSIISIIGMQIGFNACLRLESFLFSSFVGLILFFPSSFWDFIESVFKQSKDCSEQNLNAVSETHISKFNLLFYHDKNDGNKVKTTTLHRILSWLFFIYLIINNITEKPIQQLVWLQFDNKVIAKFFGINQNWGMFGPDIYNRTKYTIVYANIYGNNTVMKVDYLTLLKTNWNNTNVMDLDINKFYVPYNPSHTYTFRRWERHLTQIKDRHRNTTATYFCWEFYKYHQYANVYVNNTIYNISNIKDIGYCKYSANRIDMWQLSNKSLWNNRQSNDYRPFYMDPELFCPLEWRWNCSYLLKAKYNTTNQSDTYILQKSEL